jgi:hypothetical protein
MILIEKVIYKFFGMEKRKEKGTKKDKNKQRSEKLKKERKMSS